MRLAHDGSMWLMLSILGLLCPTPYPSETTCPQFLLILPEPPCGFERYAVSMRIALVLSLLLLPACVDRRISVTSDPPGARVWLNDTEIGRTPVQTGFKFYGVYDVRLELDGYEPIHEAREANAPIYEYPGLDLVTGLIPIDWESRVDWHFELSPRLERTQSPQELEEGLLSRARETREQIDK